MSILDISWLPETPVQFSSIVNNLSVPVLVGVFRLRDIDD